MSHLAEKVGRTLKGGPALYCLLLSVLYLGEGEAKSSTIWEKCTHTHTLTVVLLQTVDHL